MAKLFALVFLAECALLAQPQGNVVFQSAVPPPAAAFTTGVAAFAAPATFGFISGDTFGFISGEMIGGAPVKNAPYSAEAVTETTQTLADGNRIVNQSSTMVYRDSLGRERREQSLPSLGIVPAPGAVRKIIMISDPVAGVNYSLDPDNKIAMKLPAPPPGLPMLPGMRSKTLMIAPQVVTPIAGRSMILYGQKMAGATMSSPALGAPNVEQLAPKTIEGLQAEGTRNTVTIAAGQIGNDLPIQIVNEQWRSPELQVLLASQHSDPRIGSTSYTLKNVSRSEPAATLFQVPADYSIKEAPAVTVQKLPNTPQ